MSIEGLVLAAGASRRYGGPKLIEPLAGEPLVRRVVRSVRSAGLGVTVVVAPAAAGLRAALAGLAVDFVENERSADGMSSSIRAGVAVLAAGVEAVVIVPADQPTTGPELIRELCRVHRETGAGVVAPLYRGEQGPPVLFARSLFGELQALRGDRGARAVLEAHRAEAAFLAVDEPMPRDVDTRADHDALEPLLEEPS